MKTEQSDLIERAAHLFSESGDAADWSDALRLGRIAAQAASNKVELLERENTRAWTERNTAYAKVKAWESVVYVEGLPLRAVRIDEWGPGEGGQTTVPNLTPQRLTDLLDEIARLRASLNQGQASLTGDAS